MKYSTLISSLVLLLSLSFFIIPLVNGQDCPNNLLLNTVRFRAPNQIICPGGSEGRPFLNVTNACQRVATAFAPTSSPGPVGCGGERGQRWRWEVKVDGGPSGFVCQNIVVDDREKPVLSLRNPRVNNSEVECGIESLPNVIQDIVVTDNCPPPPRAVQIGQTQQGRFPSCRPGKIAGEAFRRFGAEDRCGNSADPITIRNVLVDNTPPTLSSLQTPIDARCTNQNGPPETSPPVPTDACWPRSLITVNKTDQLFPGRCGVLRQWTATDSCGNSVSAEQAVRITDSTPPSVRLLRDPLCLFPPNGRYLCVPLTPVDNPILSRLVEFRDCPGVSSVRVVNCLIAQCNNAPCIGARQQPCEFNNQRFCVQAARQGNLEREYRVILDATDYCGNTRRFTLRFIVPRAARPNCVPGNTQNP